MHHVRHVVIENYRACRHTSIPLGSYTPLVGPNNSGKSTVLEAIRWVLKPTALKSSDFFDSTKPVVVSACIDGIDEDVLDLIPKQNHRRAIEPYCRNGQIWIRVVASRPGGNNATKEVWDANQYSGDGVPQLWRPYPTGLPEAVLVLLPDPLSVQAMDDIGEDLGKAKAGSTIKSLLDEIMDPVLSANAALQQAMNTVRQILTLDGENRSTYLESIDRDASNVLAQFFPGMEIQLDLQVVDVADLFKAGDIHIADKTTGDRRRFDQMGSGTQRAVQIALIRYLAEIRSGSGGRPSCRMLLIDEPELYLHPQGVRRLRQALASLSMSGFQVIFSTHSPIMLSRENAADAIIVGKDGATGVSAKIPLRQAVEKAVDNAQSQSRTLFELGNLAEIYFADRVVLCEGKTDRRLLPLAYERLFQRPPELDHIAFVSLGSCADIPKALPVLAAMGIKACAVADLDFAYTHARKSGMLSNTADDMERTKEILKRLRATHGFSLSDDGLPQSDKRSGWTAADIWACYAGDSESEKVIRDTHEALKSAGVWVWEKGCIEQVIGTNAKGEDAIRDQEEAMRSLSADEIISSMPLLQSCFLWAKSV